MAIPEYQKFMYPLLKFAGDGQEHLVKEAVVHLAELFELTEEDRTTLLPSGQQFVFDNRVGWAKTYLKKAGLLDSPRRSYIVITPLGLKVLKDNPPDIDVKFLKQYPSFREFQTVHRDRNGIEESTDAVDSVWTPQEHLEHGFRKINDDLSQELLSAVKQSTPRFFEQLVVELLLSMGYGGSRQDAGEAVGRSGDGGIDGVIKEDKLGLEAIYIQAKRWDNTVGAPEIRNFVGSLVGHKASKGVFLTTSGFTKEAIEYVKTISHKVVLIDGRMLAQLMVEHDVGVTRVTSYNIKKIDSDYFADSN